MSLKQTKTMKNKINVLSLFDGMSCGQIALKELGIEVGKYFASEIEKSPIQTTQKNFPETIQIGDVTKVKGEELVNIDLLIGGSPCQGFSFAGKQLNFEDPRSKLFFEYVRLLKEIKPKWFFLENVKMKKEYEDVITKTLGVEPIKINSEEWTAHRRPRIYWTNIPYIKNTDVGNPAVVKDIREYGVEDDKYYLTEKQKLGMREFGAKYNFGGRTVKDNEKFPSLLASYGKSSGNGGKLFDTNGVAQGIRIITPLEAERLQGVPEGYTEGMSDRQRYKMLGNGWTVPVIKHLFKGLKNKNNENKSFK